MVDLKSMSQAKERRPIQRDDGIAERDRASTQSKKYENFSTFPPISTFRWQTRGRDPFNFKLAIEQPTNFDGQEVTISYSNKLSVAIEVTVPSKKAKEDVTQFNFKLTIEQPSNFDELKVTCINSNKL